MARLRAGDGSGSGVVMGVLDGRDTGIVVVCLVGDGLARTGR